MLASKNIVAPPSVEKEAVLSLKPDVFPVSMICTGLPSHPGPPPSMLSNFVLSSYRTSSNLLPKNILLESTTLMLSSVRILTQPSSVVFLT